MKINRRARLPQLIGNNSIESTYIKKLLKTEPDATISSPH
jgi:hypothetical protein